MTGSHHLDPTTQAASDALRAWIPADRLLARLERRRRTRGATFDTIDQPVADELGVTLHDWLGYHTVRQAADRYQRPRRISSRRSAHQLACPYPRPEPHHLGNFGDRLWGISSIGGILVGALKAARPQPLPVPGAGGASYS